MLTINRETDYAARVILHLALQPPGSRATAREIARQRLIPAALVRRVVTRLAAAGLIVTARGSDGGITLARPPAEITLLDVVEAMEGPLALNQCTVEPQFCPLMVVCTVHQAWMRARDTLRADLSRVTFADLAQKGGVPSTDIPPAR
ncbi:MAG: Rrf2 family transcriptional regulator [Anaerolineae bacterium]